jgi:hypothetical protein
MLLRFLWIRNLKLKNFYKPFEVYSSNFRNYTKISTNTQGNLRFDVFLGVC